MNLPVFTPQVRVTAKDAKHDNIQYSIPLGVFRDIPPSPAEGWEGVTLEEVAEYLGSPPSAARGSEHQELWIDYSCYFARPTGRYGEKMLFVRSEPITTPENDPLLGTVPLCAGILVLRQRGAGRGIFVTADYWANVNPTRFVRYQDANVLRSSYVPPSTPPLFRRVAATRDGDELAADGNDNWIPDLPGAIWKAFVGSWDDRLKEYFEVVEAAMRGEVGRRGHQSSADGTGTLTFSASDENWKVRSVETYWEFSASSSPELLAQFDRSMRSYSALPHLRQEFEGSSTSGPKRTRQRTGRNGVSYSVQAKPGVRITAYAKTNRRIRFEIKHTLDELRAGYGLNRSVRGVPGMLRLTRRVTEDAAEILNTFIEHFERQLEGHPVPVSPSPVDFLFQVASLCDSGGAAETIVRLLVTEGAVTRVESLNNSIDRLKRRGILERTRNSQGQQSITFVPTPMFRRAVEYLHRVSTDGELSVRQRRR